MGARLLAEGAEALLGGLVVVNNVWGAGPLQAGRDYDQRVEIGDQLSDGLRMGWIWPEGPPGADGRVLAFPEVYVGRKPWGGPQGGEALPARIQDLPALTARWSLDWGGEGSGEDLFNVAFDLWISADPEGGEPAIRQELMVWIKPAGFPSSGAAEGRLALSGLDGPLRVNRDHGDAAADLEKEADDAGWVYIAWLPEVGEGLRRGELDLAAFLAALSQRGLIDPSHWLMSVELGAEITGGTGWLEITEFEVTFGD